MNDQGLTMTITLAAIAGIIFTVLYGKRTVSPTQVVASVLPQATTKTMAENPALFYNIPPTRGPTLAMPDLGGSGGFYDNSFTGAYPQF